MSKIAEKLSGFLQRRFVTKLVNFVFECALNAIWLQLFFYTDHQPNIDCTQIKICLLLYLKCILFCFDENPITVFSFANWWCKRRSGDSQSDENTFTFSDENTFTFSDRKHFHFFLMAYFSYTFFMVELSHF